MGMQIQASTRTLLWVSALMMSLIAAPNWAAPINCGNRPINLAFMPFGILYDEQNGQGRGIDKDLVDEIVQRTGCQLTTQTVPRSRIQIDMEVGALDMTLSTLQTRERNHFAWFVPYIRSKNYAIIRADIARTVLNSSDFSASRPLQFGVIRGFKHGDALDQWLEPLYLAQRVQESTTYEILFEKLKLGRIDGLFAYPFVYKKFIQAFSLSDEITIQDWMPHDKGNLGNIALSKSRFSETDAIRWQTLIQEMRTDGTLKRIFTHYLPVEEAEQLLDF
ncbi:MAG: transporter substrate-binding domain-containing protein [Magnetococcus sp. YQC-5]